MRWHKWAGWKDTDNFIDDALVGVEVEGEAGVAVRHILESITALVQSFIVFSLEFWSSLPETRSTVRD
jgi:hypothetical protein